MERRLHWTHSRDCRQKRVQESKQGADKFKKQQHYGKDYNIRMYDIRMLCFQQQQNNTTHK